MVVKNLILSFVASLLLHGLVAAGLIAYFEYAPRPDVLATLDLSSVELSFAEQVEETAAVAPQPAMVGRTVPSPPQPLRNESAFVVGCGAPRTSPPTATVGADLRAARRPRPSTTATR